MPSVLFLCTGNSCRSQMAEAIVTARHADWHAYSAGTRPSGYVEARAIRVLAEIGIAHTGASKSFDALDVKDFDLVVTVCDSAAEDCPVWPGRAGRQVHEGFEDPSAAKGTPDEQLQVFRRVRDELLEKIPILLHG